MRITTRMLNESARKAGVQANSHSLLNYVKANKNTAAKTQADNTLNKSKRAAYEKQEKAAEELNARLQKLIEEGKDNLFEKAESSGDTGDICKEVEKIVDKYNQLLSNMKNTSGVLDNFYKKSLTGLTEDNKELLKELGITVLKDGTLKLDKNQLKGASLDALKKAFSKDGTIASKMAAISSGIASFAEANLQSASDSYLPNGNTSSRYSPNKYDFWG